MNKQHIIKKYKEATKENLDIVHDKLASKIIKKAQQYNISLFQDNILAYKLLDTNDVHELPKEGLMQISKIFISLINAEEKAQLSS